MLLRFWGLFKWTLFDHDWLKTVLSSCWKLSEKCSIQFSLSLLHLVYFTTVYRLFVHLLTSSNTLKIVICLFVCLFSCLRSLRGDHSAGSTEQAALLELLWFQGCFFWVDACQQVGFSLGSWGWGIVFLTATLPPTLLLKSILYSYSIGHLYGYFKVISLRVMEVILLCFFGNVWRSFVSAFPHMDSVYMWISRE